MGVQKPWNEWKGVIASKLICGIAFWEIIKELLLTFLSTSSSLYLIDQRSYYLLWLRSEIASLLNCEIMLKDKDLNLFHNNTAIIQINRAYVASCSFCCL